jgi:hypothetical protein
MRRTTTALRLGIFAMHNEPKLRVWRSEAIGEFHHVSNVAHPTSKFLHQSLALCFVEQGAYNVRHCGVNYSVGEGALLVAQSGDITSDDDFNGKSKYRDFHCAPKALETIAEEIKRGPNRSESVYV